MDNYIITSASTADMKRSFFEERDIPFICYQYAIDGVSYDDDLGKTTPISEFYNRIKGGAMPTTTQLNQEQYAAFFEPFAAAGRDIVHLDLSSGLTGSQNNAWLAADELMERYPGRRIVICDSLGASSGFGLQLTMIADLRDGGMGMDELVAWIEENRLNIHHWFFSTDLTHYARGGRVSNASAFMGNLLHICPLMNMDYEGHLIPREKVRGVNKVVRRIVEMMELHAKDGAAYSGKCYISHADSYEDALTVKELVQEKFPNIEGDVLINDIGTVIGAHTGPGTVALYFYGDKRVD